MVITKHGIAFLFLSDKKHYYNKGDSSSNLSMSFHPPIGPQTWVVIEGHACYIVIHHMNNELIYKSSLRDALLTQAWVSTMSFQLSISCLDYKAGCIEWCA